jgi:hypothetical protein
MRGRVALIFAALTLVVGGCQAAQPKGPGVVVTVRAEPKRGYTPPADVDAGYGSDSGPPQPVDHAYHRIDYRNLDGIVVWVEPNAATTAGQPSAAGGPPPPLDAVVDVSPRPTPGFEHLGVASVGGRVTVRGPARTYVLRTGDGDLTEVAAQSPVFTPSKAGYVQILSDDADDPVGAFYVTPTAWAKKAKNGERVTFPLPPGSYRVSTWHPILPGSSQVVDVEPGKASNLSLTVGVNSLPKPR